MLGDMRVLDLGDELLLDTERVALQALFNMIRRYKLGSDVELHKRTLELGLLSLDRARTRDGRGRGELAATSTTTCAPRSPATRSAGRHRRRRRRRSSPPRRPRRRAPRSRRRARSRSTRTRPRCGGSSAAGRATAIELDDGVIPQEAGLNERAVSFTKGCYVGQETVARLHYRGKPNRHLRGLRLSAPAEPGDELRLGEKTVGRLGTVVGLARPRPDRARARPARGRARRHADRRRRRGDRRGRRPPLRGVASSAWPRTSSSSRTSPPARSTSSTR